MTQNCYSVKYDSRSTHQICDSCLCNFKNSHSCQTLSKAWATSGNIRQKYFFLSNVLLIMFVTRSWSMFECLYWNPNWLYVIKFLSSVSIFRCFKRSSSDSFHMLGSCDIERLDVQNHPEVFFLGGGRHSLPTFAINFMSNFIWSEVFYLFTDSSKWLILHYVKFRIDIVWLKYMF